MAPGQTATLRCENASTAVLNVQPVGYVEHDGFQLPIGAVARYKHDLKHEDDAPEDHSDTFIVMAALEGGAMVITCTGTVRVDNCCNLPFEVVAHIGDTDMSCGVAVPGVRYRVDMRHAGHALSAAMSNSSMLKSPRAACRARHTSACAPAARPVFLSSLLGHVAQNGNSAKRGSTQPRPLAA